LYTRRCRGARSKPTEKRNQSGAKTFSEGKERLVFAQYRKKNKRVVPQNERTQMGGMAAAGESLTLSRKRGGTRKGTAKTSVLHGKKKASARRAGLTPSFSEAGYTSEKKKGSPKKASNPGTNRRRCPARGKKG